MLLLKLQSMEILLPVVSDILLWVMSQTTTILDISKMVMIYNNCSSKIETRPNDAVARLL